MRNRFYKYSFFTAISLFLCLFVNLPAWSSYMVGTTNVGELDSLLYQGALSNSGEDTELDWVNDFFEDDVFFSSKNDGVFNWQLVIGEQTIYAQALQDAQEYFLVKTGNIKTGYTHFLFENKDNLSYAVIDLADFGADINDINIDKVSHIGSYYIQNPEPTTMLLLGFGLLGLSGISRRKK